MLAWVSEADAQAINTAGSIRMATYRINFQIATDFTADSPSNLSIATEQSDVKNVLESTVKGAALEPKNLDDISQSESVKVTALVKDMETRLQSLREYQLAYANKHTVINNQLKRIETQWFNHLKPILLSQNKQVFYTASPQYIKDVDGFVNELQYRNEQRQTWQQFLQMVSLLLTIAIMLIGIHKLWRNVLLPIQQLIDANTKFQQSELNTRVSISGYQEFKNLGDSFNGMASTIETYQRSLENEGRIKTQHLIKANQVLSLFYDFSRQLTTSQVSLHKLDGLITDFGHIFPHLDFTLCIQSSLLNDKNSIALHDDKMKELCAKLTCDSCLIKEDIHTKTYPLTHQNDEFGELKVRPKSIISMNSKFSIDDKGKNKHFSKRIKTVEIDSSYLDSENSELIVALTNLISTALSLRKKRQQEHQLILFEERSTIARELHDSLAQSLSYLKIQVSVLEKRLKNAAGESNEANVLQSISQLKTGLSSAYQSLRDLLTTFRLSIDSDNFDDALHETANEFSLKGNFNIVVNNKVMTLNLNATEQVHLIQIAREALSNISRHAQAQNVVINLDYDDGDQYIVMNIIDDGIGISGTVDQSQHHGLMIMKERAHHLGGDLMISNNEPEGTSQGTTITTKFIPSFFEEKTTKKAHL